MTEPVVLRRSCSIALVALLQAIVPAFIASGSLYVLCRLYDIAYDNFFIVLSTIVAVLAAVLLAPPRNGSSLLSRSAPLAFSVIGRWMILLGVLLAIGYATKISAEYSRRVVLTWAVITPALLIPSILAMHEIMRRLLFDPRNARRVVIAGCNEASLLLAERLAKNSELCLRVEGFFDDRSAERLKIDGKEIRLLGRLPDLAPYVRRTGVEVIFIALPIRHIQRVMDLLEELRDTTASIYYVPDILGLDLIQSRTGEIQGIPVIAMCETPFAGFKGVTKRVTDIVIAGGLLIVAAPFMLLIALLIRLTSPGPVIFKQRRYGLDGQEIVVYKFRTMTVAEDGDRVEQARRNDSRVTPLGRVLRRYSLDELPQLINVLQGRMSLVGPRPHAVAHNEQYRKLIRGYMMRHKALPGITGLAQVNGFRGETENVQQMEARVKYDLEYLRNWSVLLDLKILAKTALRVLTDDKAY